LRSGLFRSSKRIIQVVGHKDEVSGESLPPERRRVHDAKIHSRVEENVTERVQKVTFIMRPLDLGGQWDERVENVLW
jgi:hypothetical protein